MLKKPVRDNLRVVTWIIILLEADMRRWYTVVTKGKTRSAATPR